MNGGVSPELAQDCLLYIHGQSRIGNVPQIAPQCSRCPWIFTNSNGLIT